ncbi:MAG TPA: RagB/SusD family nutrient uptake outer membrane protein [Gemmatimonadaceae bacterium]|nr:RagB/SusD family nutrient uptake outer membrane protein [Gemmatimonadaceae bacterium]
MLNKIQKAALAAVAAAALVACGNFDVTNPNQPTLDDLLSNPTRTKLSAAASGLFARSRSEITSFIWRLGSMGREGINLAGNNQPDYQEPYFGPLSPSGFGGALWGSRYALIRDANTYIEALANNHDLSAGEKAVSQAMAETLKALSFMYIVETRGKLGAPVDVGRAIDAPPAPFVPQDSVYGYALGLLADAYAKLQANPTATFPFPLPPGYTGFDTPPTFAKFVIALTAKANVLRATAGCGAACYTKALAALNSSFIDASSPSTLQNGVYFDFSNAPSDQSNDLSEPLNGVRYFADSAILYQKVQFNGTTPDLRLTSKTALSTSDAPQSIAGVDIAGTLKFTRYFTNGAPDPNHPIPIIKNEELILLRSEAEWFTSQKALALADLNYVRVNSGGLTPDTTLTVNSSDAAFVSALLYEREFSLLWEQGTTWIDARRFNLLNTIPLGVTNGSVPTIMPIPSAECNARSLGGNCNPLGG